MIKTLTFAMTLTLFTLVLQNTEAHSQNSVSEPIFESSIPVVDISKFENPDTKNEFLDNLDQALQVGFFAVVNPNIDVQTIQEGYDAFSLFFASSLEEKMRIYHPELHGQRGYFPGETALNSNSADGKEFVHVGRNNNKWPPHMNLEEPATKLFYKLKELGQPILQAISLLLDERSDFLPSMTKEGEELMRALHYFKDPINGIWAAEHTDIDLLTILPYASEKGLEVEINGEWVPVFVPKDALIVNVGDMLEAFSNGRYPSCKHRVKSTIPGKDRESIVFFIHPTDETIIKPLGKEIPKYPEGSRLDYLYLRLFSLKLLSKEMEKDVIEGEFIKKIQTLVEKGDASESVKKWYLGFQKTLTTLEEKK